jgi:hypothetical protein
MSDSFLHLISLNFDISCISGTGARFYITKTFVIFQLAHSTKACSVATTFSRSVPRHAFFPLFFYDRPLVPTASCCFSVLTCTALLILFGLTVCIKGSGSDLFWSYQQEENRDSHLCLVHFVTDFFLLFFSQNILMRGPLKQAAVSFPVILMSNSDGLCWESGICF